MNKWQSDAIYVEFFRCLILIVETATPYADTTRSS